MDNSRHDMLASSSQAQNITINPQFQQRQVLQFLGGFPSNDGLCSCHFSFDGKILASGGNERKVFINYMETFDSATALEQHQNSITDVRFKPDSTICATSSCDGTVKIWDAAKPPKLVLDLNGHTGQVTSLDFHPIQGDNLCSCDSSEIILRNLNQLVMLKTLNVGGRQVRYRPIRGDLLAFAAGNVINLFDIQNSRITQQLKGHVKEVLSICWHAGGHLIAAVSEDSARVWSIILGEHCLDELVLEGKKFQSIIYHPKYPDVLVIGAYECLIVWDPQRGQRVVIPAHSGYCTGLAASSQNEVIASVGSDGCVMLWK